jgi:hypothetical protein
MPSDGQDDEERIDIEEGDEYRKNHRSADDTHDENLSDQKGQRSKVKADSNVDDEDSNGRTASSSAKYHVDTKGKYPSNIASYPSRPLTQIKASHETTRTPVTRVQRTTPKSTTSTLHSLINFLPTSWRREIRRWKHQRKVVMYEKYSEEKLEGLIDFQKNSSLSKRVFLLILNPLTCFLTVLGIYTIPLGSLTEGIHGNSLFVLSFWLSGVLLTLGFAFSMRDALRIYRGVPFLRLVFTCVMINSFQTSLFVLLAFTWRFPVPFFHIMCGGIWILLYRYCLQAILPATKKKELRKFIKILVTQSITYGVFLCLSVLYARTTLTGQLLMIFLLPFCKVLLKQSFARQTIGLSHGRSEIQLNHVTIFTSLYQAINIQHSHSVEAIVSILIVEFIDCMIAVKYDLNCDLSYGVKDMVGASMKIITQWRKTQQKTLSNLKKKDLYDQENQISIENGSSSSASQAISADVSPQQEISPSSPSSNSTRAQTVAARVQHLRKLSLQAFGLIPSNPSPQKNSNGTSTSAQKSPGSTKLPRIEASPSSTPTFSNNSQRSKDDVTLNFDRLDEPLHPHMRAPVAMATSETTLVATVAAVAARSASNARMAALSSSNLLNFSGISRTRPFLSATSRNNSFGCLEVERGISLIDKEQVLVVNQTLYMLHATEKLMLRAYFQVVMPILIALYTGTCANLNNAKYDRLLMGHAINHSTDNATGLSLALALCHVASWIVVRFVIRYRYQISSLSQLAFALESYQLAFGGKLLVCLLFFVNFNVLHYGKYLLR